jgi:hypothetical protein
MDGLAPEHHTEHAQTLTATITSVEGMTYSVRSGATAFSARRAVSCLVAPSVGDRVLVAHTVEGAFVLAVLARDANDVELRIDRGRLQLSAADGVAVVGSEIALTAGTLRLQALAGEVVMQALDYVGTTVKAEVDATSLVARAVDQVLGRIKQRVQRAYRVVEEHEHLRAARIDYSADKTMNLHAAHVLMTSEGLVKVDGEQIHVG